MSTLVLILASAAIAFVLAAVVFFVGAVLGRQSAADRASCPRCDSADTIQIMALRRCDRCGITWDVESGLLAEHHA
jgi:hypothetical protein